MDLPGVEPGSATFPTGFPQRRTLSGPFLIFLAARFNQNQTAQHP